MKTLIAVPCMQTVPTKFMRCLVGLKRIPDTYTTIIECSMVHDARNTFASIAITEGFDRVLWIDSDMTFDPDLLERLSERMNEGCRMVSALAFKRTHPTEPVIYSALTEKTEEGTGYGYIYPEIYRDYPRNSLFEVAACGFGTVMTEVSLLRQVWDKYGPPFCYHRNIGEDMSFCWRVREMGESIWCDSSIRVGHIGQVIFDEETYLHE